MRWNLLCLKGILAGSTILLLASFATAAPPTSEEIPRTSLIEALNTFCGASAHRYQRQIHNLRRAMRERKLTENQVDEALSQLVDLKNTIKERCR